MSKIPVFELWLETEIGDPIDQPANRPDRNFCNIKITLDNGRQYALNVWTFDFVPLARIQYPYDHESSTKLEKYLFPPDLLVERLDRETLEEIVKTMLVNDEMSDEWLCKDE